ncbi:MAG: hypothetical protein ACI4NG_05595 [Candidatus Gallimonas sp.]
MWLKFALCLCVIAFGVLLGYLAAGKYRRRKSFFTGFYLLNERYLNELVYLRRPLDAFLRETRYEGDFGRTVAEFSRKRAAEVGYPYLTEEEKSWANDYFRMLGRGDARSQSGFFSAQQGELSEKKNAAEKEAKARGELYLKLGLLAGLAAVILIV